jgi:hypothetical protein
MAGGDADEGGFAQVVHERAAAMEAQERARGSGHIGGQPDRGVGVRQRQQEGGQRRGQPLGLAARHRQRFQAARMGECFERRSEHLLRVVHGIIETWQQRCGGGGGH